MERKRLVLKANNITKNGIKQNETKTLLAGDQWWPFFVTFCFLVNDILSLVIQYLVQ